MKDCSPMITGVQRDDSNALPYAYGGNSTLHADEGLSYFRSQKNID